MKFIVGKNPIVGQILYRSPGPSKNGVGMQNYHPNATDFWYLDKCFSV